MLVATAALLGAVLGLALPDSVSSYALAAGGTSLRYPANLAAAESQMQEEDVFTGVITYDRGEFMLKTSEATYGLENQGAAAQLAGKTVRIRGTFDPDTHTITVLAITPAPG
ncbi:MAG: hypothetical protein HYS61_04630 [Acidobacteria bacterium]|nr:hypothetical protein [Acidobacteriota bacterium]